MCGIVGYSGNKPASDFLLEGLRRLEYRGYDSAGMAIMQSGNGLTRAQKSPHIAIIKAVGKVAELEKKMSRKIDGMIGIAHTRWATHGKPSEKNAHPHTDCTGNIAIVHNGIIENYRELRAVLEKQGHHFRSETDTEVIAHLIEEAMKTLSFEDAFGKMLKQLRGAYGIVALSAQEPNMLLVARLSSPLVIGIGHQELCIASDTSAMAGRVKRIVYLDDREIAVIKDGHYIIKSFANVPRIKKETAFDQNKTVVEHSGYPHFMLKEIFEQPQSFADALRGRLLVKEGEAHLGGLRNVEKRLRTIKKIIIVSCGTSYHSALVGEYMLEEYAHIPTEVEMASEFRYRKPLLDKHTAVIAISQSGETADTLAAIREAKAQGVLTLGIVNVVDSTIARETDAGVYCHAGPEISVASTKAFTSQLAILTLLTLYLGRKRDMSLETGKRIARALQRIPHSMAEILKHSKAMEKIAKKYAHETQYMYLGRKYNFPNALEGALKIKEIAYVPAQGYPTGEMKHGPIALIDPQSVTIIVMPKDSVHEKNMSGVEEILARGGRVIAVATKNDTAIAHKATDSIWTPKTIEMLTPLLTVIPLQLFAYFVAVERGYDIDKPRNLAKSVTVE
ncbi:MAG: glutamine--fructose-6-phosphate transaminase (isomerizing) [Minisyncoccota bacterium]